MSSPPPSPASSSDSSAAPLELGTWFPVDIASGGADDPVPWGGGRRREAEDEIAELNILSDGYSLHYH